LAILHEVWQVIMILVSILHLSVPTENLISNTCT
jgi:hypothetical protein